MNNNEARRYFKDKGLTYDILTMFNIDLLANMVQSEILKMRKEVSDCILIRINPPKYTKKQVNGSKIEWFELTVDGTYFSKREAICFNCGGFIGFAGWASGCNTKPFIDGFVKWCDLLAGELNV